jgi:hypothetical protein
MRPTAYNANWERIHKMATKIDITDDKKVFDVAKPGKSAPEPTARPIIVSRGPQVEDPMVSKVAPSAGRQPSSAPTVKAAPAAEETEAKPEATAASSSSLSSSKRITITPLHNDKPAESVDTGKTAAEPTPEAETPEEPEKADVNPEEPAAGSAQAEVNAVAEQAGPAKKDKEDAKQKEELEKLAASKEYFVPIGEARQTRMLERFLIIVLAVLLLGLVGFNLAIDAGLIETDIRPLFDLIKN